MARLCILNMGWYLNKYADWIKRNDGMKCLDTKLDEEKKIRITMEETYNKLKPYFPLTPYYVYDSEDKKWVLSGKLDCDYFVDVKSGEITKLNGSFFIN